MAALPAGAFADDCIKIENSLDRLACYDKASGRTPKVTAAPSAGAWEVKIETSKMTDTKSVYVTAQSEDDITCSWRKPGKMVLLLRCVENTTALFFGTDCHMTSSAYADYGKVTYRLDQEKAASIGMDESTDHRALGLWSGSRAIPMIKTMLGKSRMIVRMTPFSESPISATFNIAGLEEAIKPLREACRW